MPAPMQNDEDLLFRQGTCRDQHGRAWAAEFRKRNGFPEGLVRPKGWSAPWLPDQSYFKFRKDEPNRFDIDYERLLTERTKDHEAYEAQYRSEALKRGWNPDDKEKAASIREIVGQEPLPVQPIVAAMQGNKWILGMTEKVDPRLVPFLRKREDKKQQILAAMDFSDPDELDIEEQEDADAVGGKKQPVRKQKQAKTEVAA